MPSAPVLSRRRLLYVGGALTAALAGGVALLMRGSSAHYRRLLPEGIRPRVLSVKELAVLAAVCDRLVPPGPGRPTMREARLAERLDRELQFHTEQLKEDFRAALLVIEHAGLVAGSPTRFTKLDLAAQDAYLERMSRGSDLERQALSAVRLVALFFYYCDERTWPGIGYQGPRMSERVPPEADSNPLASGTPS